MNKLSEISRSLLFLTTTSLVLAALSVSADPAPTLYVDGNVAVSGDGSSWAAAYKTIQDAHLFSGNSTHREILVRGDQIYYFDNLLEITKGGASPTERKIFRGVPGTNGMDRLPIVSGAPPYDETAFTLSETHSNVYWTPQAVRQFQAWEGPLGGEWGDDWTLYSEQADVDAVQNTQASWHWDGTTFYVHTSNDAHPTNFLVRSTGVNNAFQIYNSYITIENFEVRHTRSAGIYVVLPDYAYVTISNCVVHHTGKEGINSRGASHVDILDNRLFAIPSDRAIKSANTSVPHGSDIRIVGNTIELDGSAGQGIVVASEISEISGNVIRGASRGIMVDVGDNARIFNNLMVDGSGSYGGLWLRNAAQAQVFNNTFVNNTDWEIYLQNVSTNARVFNNLVVSQGGNGCLRVDATAEPGLQSDYNNLDASGGASVGNLNGTLYASLAEWQSASGQDTHSIGAAPQFIDADAGDYRLDRPSPSRDRGTALFGGIAAPTLDLDGNPRPINGAYDQGAYEYRIGCTVIMLR